MPHPRSTALIAAPVVTVAIMLGMLGWVAPSHAPVARVALETVGVLAIISACAMGLFMALPAQGGSSRAASATRSTAILIIPVTIGLGVRAGLDLRESTQLSADILVDRPDLGTGAAVLRKNLQSAIVVTPDMPHNPRDLSAGNRYEQVTRKRTFQVNTNSAGFRGPEHRAKTGPRIAAVGDSFTFGWGLDYEAAWPQQLQALADVEVLNLGIPAANMTTLAGVVREQGPSWRSDIVLICEWPRMQTQEHIERLTKHIANIQESIGPTRLGLVLPPVSTFDALSQDIGDQTMSRLQQALPDIPILDLTPPLRASGGSGVELRRAPGEQTLVSVPSGEVLVQASASGVDIAQPILERLRQDEALNEPLFFDGGHPTAEGHKIAAHAVWQWLIDLGWIQD